MRFRSTSLQSPDVGFREAVLRGIAPDGGLYLPVDWPTLGTGELARLRGLSFGDLSAALASRLLEDDVPAAVVTELVKEALDFPVPNVSLGEKRWVLELFHGPTLAFKDVGARFLARLLGYLLDERGDRATVLVATSGDTGSAVANGFLGVANVRVVVLYPRGRVSPFQEAQMATLGGNVTAVRVPATFDKCQALVKRAFLDAGLAHLGLSSANSINVGRLLPQCFYYAASWLSLPAPAAPVVFAVPSGNFGNLTAGVLAQRLGVPVRRFVAATNANRIFPDYLDTGTSAPRPAVATISNAMDVGDPSNLPRLVRLCGGSHRTVRSTVWSASISEEETRATIRETWQRRRYLLDPHGAVGLAAAERYAHTLQGDDPIVTLATAHPAKFGQAIGEELGFEPALPEPYRDWRSRRVLAVDLAADTYDEFRELLMSLTPA
jgi:threonine synthase